MRKKQVWAHVFGLLGLALSHVMCAAVAYNYAYLKVCPWCSAPAWTAFWLCVPFCAGIILCGGLAWLLWRRGDSDKM